MFKNFTLESWGVYLILPSWILGRKKIHGEAEGKVRMLADAKCELTKASWWWVIGGMHWAIGL